MIFQNSLDYLSQFYFFIIKKVRGVYLNSNIYNNKISKTSKKDLEYKPSASLLDCLIKFEKKKNKIEDYSLSSVWKNNLLKYKDYKKLHSFFWLLSLDLKSSKKATQSIILNWIKSNSKYNSKNWEIDILSKRIISWISNSKLTYEEGSEIYKKEYNQIIHKQVNHLINEIDRSESVDDKMIGCSAIILTGLSYHDEPKYLNFGLNLLKKIIKVTFDDEGFPKSRNIRQMNFYFKYFVLIREWLKEAQNNIPEYLDEIIYYLGQAHSLITKNFKNSPLFNGNNESNIINFENYLIKHGYKFKNENNETGGYAILNNKKISLIMDIGSSPEKKFSNDYQSGALSFEILYNQKKLICNSGYFQNYKHQLNGISKTSAAHSTLIVDNLSSCKIRKKRNQKSYIENRLKIIKKSIIHEKNYWSINSAHDGYMKKFGIIHDRQIEFYPEMNKFIGHDKLINKKQSSNYNFEVRFHLEPNTKVMKTQDNKSIFIEVDKDGWKFSSENYEINIEDGLYFGQKNNFLENQNIVISGMTKNEIENIKWEILKIT